MTPSPRTTDLNTTENVSSSAPLLPGDIGQQLANMQALLAGLQQQHFPVWGAPPSQMQHPMGAPQADPSYYLRLVQTQMQTTGTAVADLRTEVTAIKSRLQSLSAPATLCSGPMALAACLLAISFVAIIVIILASLGLAGVLPQVSAILVNTSNAIWTIVSASIVTVICLISVLCVTLIRHHKPITVEPGLSRS
ncbi:hypothetical protein [Chlamydia vaughanii]|uniref:hypothetical protein n=1 Tax=Chlamydia vaughanii TaxID=3112552 RepID=UPI0032B28C6A